ncbi:NUDIX hydrolase [Massilia terrae]|uniref:Phosphatase NudJ n=1 Tax=Massilia terrae TaxID=1811224 RepID=A0ABT2D5E0_9BURK|nr:NUDIX hydrolase [Massilia terrae]MCS0660981.1 NUDIX hydrolase [Massilia terrae]
MTHTWKPSVTVAAIIERDGRFLLIEEETSEGIRINQPAGHLDPHESLEQAVVREVLEETAHEFLPEALVGMYMSRYLSKSRGRDVTYLRFTFCGKAGKEYDQPLDHGILRTLWLTREELAACSERHRSPIVLQCVDDYLAGRRTALALLHTHASVYDHALTIKTDAT